jgi:O-antigen ligase
MLKFLLGLVLIAIGFGGALFYDPVWGLYLFACFTHIRLEQLGDSISLPLRVPIVVAGLTVVLYLLSSRYRNKFRRWPLEVWLLGIMVIGMCVGSAGSEFQKDASWELTSQYAKYWVFFILMIQMMDSIKKIDQFHWVMILSAAWLVYRCWDLRGTTGERFENIGGGTVADSNHFAAALVLLFPFVLHRILDKDKRIAIGAAILSFGVLASIVISGSRGGALGFLALGLLAALALRQHRKKILAALAVLGLCGLVIANQSQIERLSTILTATHEEQRDQSAQLRIDFWKLAIDLFKEHPVFGVGPNNFVYYSGPRVEHLPPGRPGHVTHSIWFELISERGLFGAVPFVIMLYRFFRNSLRIAAQYRARGQPEMAMYVQVPMLGLGAFLVSATFLDRLVYEPIYWCIALGVAHRYIFEASPENAMAVSRAKPAARPMAVPATSRRR